MTRRERHLRDLRMLDEGRYNSHYDAAHYVGLCLLAVAFAVYGMWL